MTTQRDLLAAVLHDEAIGCGYECGPLRVRHEDAADALLARGVRVVPDPERFDQDERDLEAEARFLQPINPNPVTPMAAAVGRQRKSAVGK